MDALLRQLVDLLRGRSQRDLLAAKEAVVTMLYRPPVPDKPLRLVPRTAWPGAGEAVDCVRVPIQYDNPLIIGGRSDSADADDDAEGSFFSGRR